MTQERKGFGINGWAAAFGLALLIVVELVALRSAAQNREFASMFVEALALVATVLSFNGLFTLQPNEAAVILLFGKYKWTETEEGLHWTNPLATRMKISLRARNLNVEKLKVNDKTGNPIEIAAVVVWRVADTAKACFDVNDYAQYIALQSESALRHLASSYGYDQSDATGISLRASGDVIAETLKRELSERLEKAGVVVEEARLTHLAYAPEIAGVMLKRQQAEAVIAAREKIVHGAVSMVEMALNELSERRVLELDAERKAAMVSNLLVVLCAESEAQPVINAGTIYP